jgi:hypothetical protein
MAPALGAFPVVTRPRAALSQSPALPRTIPRKSGRRPMAYQVHCPAHRQYGLFTKQTLWALHDRA